MDIVERASLLVGRYGFRINQKCGAEILEVLGCSIHALLNQCLVSMIGNTVIIHDFHHVSAIALLLQPTAGANILALLCQL